MKTFGKLLREKRIALGFTLRTFCGRFGYDPAYISRLERNLMPAPESKEKIEALANALSIEKNSPDWVEFFDLAYLSKGKIPEDIGKNDHLPLLFRTIRGKRLSKQQLEKLVKLLNES